MGLFPVATPPPVPHGMRPIASKRLVVLLLRYQEGTLTYDELMIGFMARRGRRAGIHLHGIWVDDLASLWGGREIWGVPKELAEFTWASDSVKISDEDGVITEIALDRRTPALVPVRMPLAGFGILDDRQTFITGTARGRPAIAGLEILQWSEQLPELRKRNCRVGLTTSFTMTVPAPKILSGQPASTTRSRGVTDLSDAGPQGSNFDR